MSTIRYEVTDYLGKIRKLTMSRVLYKAIEEMKFDADNKLDNVVIITGMVGSGKSNIGDGIAGTYQNIHLEKDYNLDMVYFSADKVTESTDKDDNIGEVIKFDEAIIGGSGRAVLTSTGQKLVESLVTKRRKRHLWIFITDEIQQLNKKIISRCKLLIDVYYYKDKSGKKPTIRKGMYRMYSGREAKQIYRMIKEDKIQYVHDYKSKDFRKDYSSMNYADIWFKEDDYENKKIVETKQINSKNQGGLHQRDNLISYCYELGAKQHQIASVVGLTQQTVQTILRKNKQKK